MRAIIQLRERNFGAVGHQIEFEPSPQGVKVTLRSARGRARTLEVVGVGIENPRELLLKVSRIAGEASILGAFGNVTDEEFIESLNKGRADGRREGS